MYLLIKKKQFIHQGVVCVLGEADDFGKLALVNDAPR